MPGQEGGNVAEIEKYQPPPRPRGKDNVVSKYNDEVHTTLVELALKGYPRTVMFQKVGIHPDSGFFWLRQGRDKPDEYPWYAQLVDDIEQAEAQFAADMMDEVRDTATSKQPHTWQAAAWLLERRRPEEFAKREKHELTAGDRPLVQLNQVVLVDPEARETSRALLRRVAAGGPSVAIGPSVGDESPEDGS
jgi:hypothetical protein